GALHPAAAHALDADAHLLHRAVELHADVLQVRLELAPADPGDFTADAAQVLGLAAARVLITQHRLLPTDGTLHAHGATHFPLRVNTTEKLSIAPSGELPSRQR